MIKIYYTENAKRVLKHVKDFNKDKFELWLIHKGIGVGHSTVIEYLIEKELQNGDSIQ